MIFNNLRLVRESVVKFQGSLDEGARGARDEMMTSLIQLTQEEIKGERPYEKVGKTRRYSQATPGEPPMNRTGRLRRSVHGEKFNMGFAKYEALVGPGVIYGRVLEVGFANGNKYPYMAPAFRKFQAVAPMIIRKHIGNGV
jgi:hypothetical protein